MIKPNEFSSRINNITNTYFKDAFFEEVDLSFLLFIMNKAMTLIIDFRISVAQRIK